MTSAEYHRAYYYRTHERRNQLKSISKKARIKLHKERVRDYLEKNPCVDCNEADPVVLDFDHVKGKKIGNVSEMVVSHSWKKIEAEIKKCKIRCSNCHRRKTHKERH